MAQKLTSKSLNFNERNMEMILAIQKKMGLATFTSTVQYCISVAHKFEFRDSARSEAEKKKREILSPKKSDAEKEKALETLCRALPDGKLKVVGGAKVCQYITRDGVGRKFENKVSLDKLSPEYVNDVLGVKKSKPKTTAKS